MKLLPKVNEMQKQELGIFRIILGSPHLDCVYAFQKHCSFGHWDTQRDKKKRQFMD